MMSPRLTVAFGAILLAVSAATTAEGQQAIELEKARSNVNRYVLVEGMVADVRRERGGQIWLSLKERYPKGPLVIVLTADILRSLPDPASFLEKYVRVRGQIQPGADGGAPPPTGGPATPNSGNIPRKPFIRLEDPGRLEIIPTPPGS
jgi:hypothetical protein